VIDEYVRSVGTGAVTSIRERVDREGSGRLRFKSLAFLSDAEPTDMPITGRDAEIALEYETDGPVRNVSVGISVYTLLGGLILQLHSEVAGTLFREVEGHGEIRCRLPRMPLPAGRYWINLFAGSGAEVLDWVQRAADMTVAEGDFFGTGQRQLESHQAVMVDQEWALAVPERS
jgi:hypothetical protein